MTFGMENESKIHKMGPLKFATLFSYCHSFAYWLPAACGGAALGAKITLHIFFLYLLSKDIEVLSFDSILILLSIA